MKDIDEIIIQNIIDRKAQQKARAQVTNEELVAWEGESKLRNGDRLASYGVGLVAAGIRSRVENTLMDEHDLSMVSIGGGNWAIANSQERQIQELSTSIKKLESQHRTLECRIEALENNIHASSEVKDTARMMKKTAATMRDLYDEGMAPKVQRMRKAVVGLIKEKH